jgi:recombination protein RecR
MIMHGIAEPVSRLIDEFVKLPGVGPKTAQRLAYFVLRLPDEEARRLAEAIVQVKERVVLCNVCFNVTERNPCALCANPARDHGKICVVEEPLDVTALERTGIYRGLYHVLHGALNPQDGIGPDDLKVAELVERVRQGGLSEVIVATNPNQLGDATANWIVYQLAPLRVRVTRLARGLPIGSDLEYADEVTLSRALEGRAEYH